MARNNIFKGTIELIAGLRPKNDRDFALLDAHYIVADDDGTRLDERLSGIDDKIKNSTVTTVYNEKNQTLTIEGGTTK